MFFFVAVYLNALATMVATHRNPYAMMLDRSGEPLSAHTLPDLGHDLWAFLLTRYVYGCRLLCVHCAVCRCEEGGDTGVRFGLNYEKFEMLRIVAGK